MNPHRIVGTTARNAPVTSSLLVLATANPLILRAPTHLSTREVSFFVIYKYGKHCVACATLANSFANEVAQAPSDWVSTTAAVGHRQLHNHSKAGTVTAKTDVTSPLVP